MIERTNAQLSLKAQAELLGLSRASLYYKPTGPSARELAVKHRIDEIYTRLPFYGSRRITEALEREGISISRPTVQRYMRAMGIQGIAPGPNLSKRNPEHKIYPYLLRGLRIEHPNQVWGIDITYIRLAGSWMYLVAVLDWYSRYVVAWELDQTLEIPFVLQTIDRALDAHTPEICNSDQGSHFTSPQFTSRLQAADVHISMDGRGRAVDNIYTERLWRSLKYEEVYLNEYRSPRQARQGIEQYMAFYNQERLHQSLDYQTPAEIYFQSKESTLIRPILVS